MTEPQPPAADEPIVVDQTDRRSVVPFVAAGIFAVLVLAAIIIGGVVSPAEKNVTEADRITAAVNRFVEGSNQTAAVPPPGTGCPDFDPKRSPLAGRSGPGKTVEVTKIENPMVDGDRAKATVTTKVEGNEATGLWNLTRSGDKWLVCN
ncbi:Rv0361 family membrane protein [Nocardia brasiliensis]|uniref:Rv0361 family membrane protein n=1 Tax=Nocardia brasiliensis TaxID=37326 RepID=UPI0024540887|nr:hypothetical protein [Nocardia brasiliensis]